MVSDIMTSWRLWRMVMVTRVKELTYRYLRRAARQTRIGRCVHYRYILKHRDILTQGNDHELSEKWDLMYHTLAFWEISFPRYPPAYGLILKVYRLIQEGGVRKSNHPRIGTSTFRSDFVKLCTFQSGDELRSYTQDCNVTFSNMQRAACTLLLF